MPSSIDRSAPPENASLPEVTTTPLTALSAEVCFTISSSSRIVVSSSTFIERGGMSHVTRAMPSASVSTLRFLKAMLSLPRCRLPFGAAVVSAPLPLAEEIVGWAKAHFAPCPPFDFYSEACLGGHALLCPPYGRLWLLIPAR